MVRVRMLEKLLVAALCFGIPSIALASGKVEKSSSSKSGKKETESKHKETESDGAELKAVLTPAQGLTGSGKASYETEGTKSEFELEAKLPPSAIGTLLTVSVLVSDGGSPPTTTSYFLGTSTVGKGGKLKLKLKNPTATLAVGQTVVVSNDANPAAPVVILSGVLK